MHLSNLMLHSLDVVLESPVLGEVHVSDAGGGGAGAGGPQHAVEDVAADAGHDLGGDAAPGRHRGVDRQHQVTLQQPGTGYTQIQTLFIRLLLSAKHTCMSYCCSSISS